MIIGCQEMLQLEAEAFRNGIEAEALMEEAGKGIAEVIKQFFPKPATLVLCLGKGNNAGDALVATRYLVPQGWEVLVRSAYPVDEWKELPQKHWQTIASQASQITALNELNHRRGEIVLLDGLVGIGAKGTLRPELASVVDEMNELRSSRHASVVALDIPSGLDPESGVPGESCVVADITIAVAYAKAALVADAAHNHVGRQAVVPLEDLQAARSDGKSGEELLLASHLLKGWPPRNFDFHKGQAGRVGIIAGSRGLLGAAELCARGALAGGAGLVTLYVKESIYPIAASRMPAEVMVKPVEDYSECLNDKFDVLAIGPGLGNEFASEILHLIRHIKCPMVLDADALNILATAGVDTLDGLEAPMLLTPHPGEMKRLLSGRSSDLMPLSRSEQAAGFIQRYPGVTLLLKGSRTVIASAGHPLAFNSTGSPGMASGGMGDTLTGLCAALIGQGVSLHQAACLGAWLSGRAAEIALTKAAVSQESLIAETVQHHLGAAFKSLRALDF